jgi:hypothetical protein
MKVFKLYNMHRGWFVGDFEPTAFHADFEVGVRKYYEGDEEAPHYHVLAKELTLILDGRVEMDGQEFDKGDIVMIEENDFSGFRCLEDCTLIIVKTKSVKGDKYPC